VIRRVSQIREELADREAIRDVLLRYCRASDRADEGLLRSVYWPDATDDHLEFSGGVDSFVDWAMPNLSAMRFNMHTIGNMLIVIDGAKADVESYFLGYHSVPNETGERYDSFSGGRYLDNFEKRNDEWRIKKRVITVDWFRDFTDTQYHDLGPFGMKVPRGDISPDDISCRLLSLFTNR